MTARNGTRLGLQDHWSQGSANAFTGSGAVARFAAPLVQLARLGDSTKVTNRDEMRAHHGVRFALVALSLGIPACSSPTAPPPPPSGGQTLVLSFSEFQQSVEPVLVRQGCDAAGDCHGGGIRGTFELSPPTAKNDQFDFDQTVLQVYASQRAQSPILTAPLAAHLGGTPHPYKPFASTDDPDYQAILQWIMAGTLQ